MASIILPPSARKGPVPHARYADEQIVNAIVPQKDAANIREKQQVSRPMICETKFLWAKSDDPELAQEQQSAMVALVTAIRIADDVSAKVIAHNIRLLNDQLEPLRAELRRTKDAMTPITIRINQALDVKRGAVNAVASAKLRASVALDSMPKASNYPTASEYAAYDEKVRQTAAAVIEAEQNVQGWADNIASIEREKLQNLQQHQSAKTQFDNLCGQITALGGEIDIIRGTAPKKNLSGTTRGVLGLS
jgi:hypothetical protein